MIVLDTHVWLWWINLELARIPGARQTQIETADRIAALAEEDCELMSFDSQFPAHRELGDRLLA